MTPKSLASRNETGKPDHPVARMAYLAFECHLQALVFAAAAGPSAWGSHVMGTLRPGQTVTRWIVRDTVVRFPHTDIANAGAALRRLKRPLRALIDNVLDS